MTDIILVPQENPNDEEVTLVQWHVSEGELVKAGHVLALIETTKSTVDIEATSDGYARLLAAEKDVIAIGAPIAAITATPDEQVQLPSRAEETQQTTAPSDDRKATKKAELVARKLGVSIDDVVASLQEIRTVTEADVENFAQGTKSQTEPATKTAAAEGIKRVLIVGGGYGATQLLDAISRIPDLVPVGVVDDNAGIRGQWILGSEVIGSCDDVSKLWEQGRIDGVCISIGSSIPVRQRLFDRFVSEGVPLLNVIDPSAVISADVRMGVGNFLSALSRIGPSTTIGDNNYLSSYVSIDHHSTMGDHCTFGPGVMTSGTVQIGSRVLFGTGIFIEPGVKVGDDCIVASGVTLTKSVPPAATVKARESSVIRNKNESKQP